MEKRARDLLALCDGPRADIEDALAGALAALHDARAECDKAVADAVRAEADAIHAEAERDEARAALARAEAHCRAADEGTQDLLDQLAALREAATWLVQHIDEALDGSCPDRTCGMIETPDGGLDHEPDCLVATLTRALSAAAPIAGRYRASVLREAAQSWRQHSHTADADDMHGVAEWLEALADAAEKGGGHE